MPLYEYKCAKCGDVFELIQKFSDAPLQEHPGCGGTVEKLVSAAALQFKGSGWYVNDYGRNGSRGSEKHKEKASADSGSKSSDTPKGESSEKPKPAATQTKETASTKKE